MTSNETKKPTHTPLFLGSTSEDAVCDRHGEMERTREPLIEIDGRVHAARNGVTLCRCPECCIDLLALAGEPNAGPERATAFLWERYLQDDWEGTIERFFVDLGPGSVEATNERSVVLLDDAETATIPKHLRESEDVVLRDTSESRNNHP